MVDHPAPVTRRVAQGVGLICASVLADPLWDPHDVQDALVDHHTQWPGLPVRTVCSPPVTERIELARRDVPGPIRNHDPHDLIERFGWVGVVMSWSPLAAPTHGGGGAIPAPHAVANRLVGWADSDRRWWQGNGFLPWEAAVHISHTRAHRGTLERWQRREAAQGYPAAFWSLGWGAGRELEELMPALRSVLEVARVTSATLGGPGDF